MTDETDKPQRKRGGRRRFEPTDKERKQVRMMAGLGIPHVDIAAVIGITAPTLRKAFRNELDVGEIEANTQVAASLFRQATDQTKPNTIAAIFWLKCRAGWRDHDPAQALGKKEQQAIEAERVASDKRFAPGTAPPALRIVK